MSPNHQAFCDAVPLLYHATSLAYARSILTRGLIPKFPGSRDRNSAHKAIFLGTDIPLHYAVGARGDTARGAVIFEIPTRNLNPRELNPGVDFATLQYMDSQKYRKEFFEALRRGISAGKTRSEKLDVVRSRVYQLHDEGVFCVETNPRIAIESLKRSYEVTHMTQIPPASFSRVLFFEPSYRNRIGPGVDFSRDVVGNEVDSELARSARLQITRREFDKRGLTVAQALATLG